MNSKISALFMLPLILGVFTSCGNKPRQSINEGSNVLTKEILKANTSNELNKFYHIDVNASLLQLTDQDYSTSTRTVISVGDSSFVRFNYTDGEISLYSPIKREMVLPKKAWTTIDTLENTLVYAFLEDSEGNIVEMHYFDQNGNEVWSTDDGLITQFQQFSTFDDSTKTTQTWNMYQYRDDLDITHIKIQIYENEKIGRSFIDQTPDGQRLVQNEGEPFDFDFIMKSSAIDLSEANLKGYHLYEIGSKWYIYDEKGDVVSSYTIPRDYGDFIFLDKTAIMQKTYVVDSHYNGTTYFDSGSRYALETVKIDILSGKTTYIDVDYVIQPQDSNCYNLYDEKQEYIKYSVQRVALISEYGNLETEDSYWIIDSNGHRHNNVKNIYLPDFYQWGDYYLVEDGGTGLIIYDQNLDKYAHLTQAIPLINTEYLIFIDSNGGAGLLDRKLNVISDANFIPSSLSYGEANTFFAATLGGQAGFYTVENGNVVGKKLFDSWQSYNMFENMNGLLVVQKEVTDPIECYNVFNGEEVDAPTNIPFLPEGAVECISVEEYTSALGVYGLGSADTSLYMFLLSITYVGILK